MTRRGSITSAALAGTGLAGLAAGVGATAMALVQDGRPSGTTVDVLVTAGIVVTLLLLILGKIISNEKVVGRIEGTQAENSRRDDGQDKTIAELWAEVRGVPELARRAKHDAVNDVTGKLADMQLRYERQVEKLEERVRELEQGGTRRGT